MNRPQPIATSWPLALVPRTVLMDAKSTPPSTQPIGGMITALTRVLTTIPNDAPMMTPMARASALDWVRKARNPFIYAPSVLDDLGEVLGLCDPVGDLALGRDPPDHAGPGRHDLLERLGQIRGVPLGELGWRVHARSLQQIGVLRANALDPHQVDVVHPLEDELAADAGRVLERCAARL